MASPALRSVPPAAEPPGGAASPLPGSSQIVAAAPEERAAPGTASNDVDEIAVVVRERRIHFDVDREYVDGPSGRVAAGWTVRLFALHDKGTHAVPVCSCCRRLTLELRRLAATVLCAGSLQADVEVGAVSAALYDSKALPGRDEIALAVRVWPQRRGADGPGADDRCAGALRRELKHVGVAES